MAGAFSLTGLLIADSILFFISRKGAIWTSRLFSKKNSKLIQKLESDFVSHATRTIIISALLPKIRFLSPIVAASSGISWIRFISVNGVITAAYVTFYITAGMFFNKQLELFSFHLKAWRHLMFAALVVLIAICFLSGESNPKSGKLRINNN